MKSKKNIVFVSYELYPINPGGCGVLIWNAIQKLLEVNDVNITLLLDMPKFECDMFKREHKPKIKNNERLNIVCLSEILKNKKLEGSLEDFKNIFMWKSYMFYQGLLEINKQFSIDYIEFFDYVGIGYFAIRAKKYEGQFDDCIMGIRAHCTIDLMDVEQNQFDFCYEKLMMFQMEKQALQECDVLLVPSKAWGETYIDRYGLNENQILVSPPPMDTSDFPRFEMNDNNSNVLFYGRLFQLKGVDTFVDAAIVYIINNPQSTNKFYLVGYDGKAITGQNYKEYLEDRIPEKYKERFVFTGQLSRSQLAEILKDVQIAVFPNYVESFCYSIHEMYNAGVPIICRPIPSFKDYFSDGENCICFDGTVNDLSKKIELVLENEELRKKISRPYQVLDSDDFVLSYQEIIDKDKFKKDSLDITTDEKVSLIIIDDSAINDSLKKKRLQEILKNKRVSTDKSYILSKKTKRNLDIPIWFLGEKWFVTNLAGEIPQNQTLPIGQYFWVGKIEDSFSGKFLEKSISILDNNLDLDFVGSYSLKITRDKLERSCIHYDIISDNKYFLLSDLSRTIIRSKKNTSLRDIFDLRHGRGGENEFLHRKGYILPYFYQKNSYYCKTPPNEYATFFIHNMGKEQEWRPFELYPLIYINNEITEKAAVGIEDSISIKRLFYHRLKENFDGQSGLVGKIMNNLLSIAYKIAKK